MRIRHYDVLVIGSGGGTKISTPASRLGLKAAIIEKDRLGGTCLNRGCIPSKMLIHAAEVAYEIEHAHRHFLNVPKGLSVNFSDLVSWVSEEIDAESDSILPAYRKNENLDYYHGEAVFSGPREVTVRGVTLRADKVFIATGSRPFIPPIAGLAETPYMTSTEALRNKKQPKKLVVLGGGYIACELAFFFAALGTEVHVIARSRLIRAEDHEVQEAFEKAFANRCNVHLKTATERVRYQDGVFTTDLRDEHGNPFSLESDELLVATGIVPNSDRLNLQAAGVEVNEKGFIRVDDRLRTTAQNVWALGDVVGNYLFRHSVNLEGEYLFKHVITDPSDAPIDYGAMPHAVFSSPQVAGVGPTENQLKADGIDYVVGFRNYAQSAMGMALRPTEGFVKLLVERKSLKILGCHIIGYQSSVLIHQIITLMEMNGTLDDLLKTVFVHPALNEIVRNAARDARSKLQD